MPTVLLAVAVTGAGLLAAVLPTVQRHLHQYRTDRARHIAAEHRRRQLGNVVDWVISKAVREALCRPVTDLHDERFMVISVSAADVVRRAEDDFNLQISRHEALVLLRDRLAHRGYPQTAITDDYDQPPA